MNENDTPDLVIKKIKEHFTSKKSTNKFIECISDLVLKIAPHNYFRLSEEKPLLKDVWNFIKKAMEDYLALLKVKSTFVQSDRSV